MLLIVGTVDHRVQGLAFEWSRTVPGAVDVWGEAVSGSIVGVNAVASARQGVYFHRAVPVDNSAAPQYQDINVNATMGEEGVSETGGHVFVPKTPEAFTHDADGNLTADGDFGDA